MSHTENRYVDKDLVKQRLATESHRSFVGGMWAVIGPLQLAYLKDKGLSPDDRLVDVGCGSLRGGVHFVDYLAPYHYFGFDITRAIIEAGVTHELAPLGLQSKVRAENFAAADNFDFPEAWRDMDVALALSLFTHLSLNSIALCLLKLRPLLKDGARFHASIFQTSAEAQTGPVTQADGIISHMCRDPYHYTQDDMAFVARKSGFVLDGIESFGHPRNQVMAIFSAR